MARRTSLIARRLASGRQTAEIAAEVRSSRRWIPDVLADLDSEDKRIKNAAIKILAAVSESDPHALYQDLDRFLGYLDSPSNIFRWNATDIVCRLAAVDEKKAIGARVLKKLCAFIDDESMVTAAHAVDNLWRVARSKPRLRKRITDELLRVPDVPREEKCRAILAGKALESLGKYADQAADRSAMVTFAKRMIKKYPDSTRKKAERFLKKFG